MSVGVEGPVPTWDQFAAALPLVVSALTTIAAILAWIAKIRWSNEYKDAKQAQIQSLESQVEGAKNGQVQLKEAKDAHITNLQSQIDFLEKVSSKDYLNNLANQNQELQRENQELREELKKLKTAADQLTLSEGEMGKAASGQIEQLKISLESLKKELTETIQHTQESSVLEWDPSLIIGPRCSWMHFTDGVKCLINMGSAATYPIKVGNCKLETWFREEPTEKRIHTFKAETILLPGQQPDLIKSQLFEHEEIAGHRLIRRNLKDTYRDLMYRLEVELSFGPKPGKAILSTDPKAAFGPSDGWWLLLQSLGPYRFQQEGMEWQLAIIGQDVWNRETGDWSIKGQLAQINGSYWSVIYRIKGEVVSALRKHIIDPGQQGQRIWDACVKHIHNTVLQIPDSPHQEIVIQLREQEILRSTPEEDATSNGKAVRRRILQALLGHDETSSSTLMMDKTLSAMLGLELKVVQDQMEVLEAQGLIQMAKAFGPSYGGTITPLGRLHYEENQ